MAGNGEPGAKPVASTGRLRLVEEDGLGGRVVGIVEVVEAHADKAEALRGGEGDAFSEGQRDADELFAGCLLYTSRCV